MRLAIVNLTGGGFSGGYKKYLKNMLPRLVAHPDVASLLCISPDGNDIPTWFEKPLGISFVTCSPLTLRHLTHIADSRMLEGINQFSPDVVFFPVDRHIKFNDLPVVNMVRNMEPFVPNHEGDSLKEILKKWVQRKLTCSSVSHADHTIAVSGFVEDYLIDTLRLSRNKVSKIYHGLSTRPQGNERRPVVIPKGWDTFLFTCGSVRPARGLEDIIEALGHLKASGSRMRLVIAGETLPGMRAYRRELEAALESRGLNGDVCWAGNLNESEMGWCYRNCSFFVMTSRVEACPNIALEAMSYGCACISTEFPPMPEFFGDAAVYYSKKRGKLLHSVIREMLTNIDENRKAFADRSRKQVSQFSWDSCAKQTVAELSTLVDKKSGLKKNICNRSRAFLQYIELEK